MESLTDGRQAQFLAVPGYTEITGTILKEKL